MDAARTLRDARRRAHLTQRALASRSGIPQPAIARIERGTVVPRVDTLDRLEAGSLHEKPSPGKRRSSSGTSGVARKSHSRAIIQTCQLLARR